MTLKDRRRSEGRRIGRKYKRHWTAFGLGP
jgi:hypothetical protein